MNNLIVKKISPLIFIFMLAFLLRLLFLFTYDGSKMMKNEIYAGDGLVYSKIAVNFLEGKGFVIDSIYARRPPVYPGFLAFVYFFTKNSVVAVRFIQTIIGALSCLLIFLIAREIFNGSIAAIAGIIAAIDYSLIQLCSYIVSETCYIFFLLVMFLFVIRYFYSRKILNLYFSGIFAGLTVLTRESGLFLIPLVAIWLIYVCREDLKIALKNSFIFVFLAVLIICPWSIRNAFLYHEFVPIAIGAGHSLYVGNNELTIVRGGGDTPWQDMPAISEEVGGLFTPQADSMLKKKALNFILNNPNRFFVLSKDKLINMWRPFYAETSVVSKVTMLFSYLPVFLLGLAGFVLGIKKSKVTILFITIVVFYTILHIFTVASIRFRYPLMPLFMIYASFALFCIFEKLKRILHDSLGKRK